mmetsp:Transcript_9608/g.11093  ORF Transcript_9608/g.11093 Transcript_9608/m.11093 type:complete len:118 (-) Transcript_9608:1-354(-)
MSPVSTARRATRQGCVMVFKGAGPSNALVAFRLLAEATPPATDAALKNAHELGALFAGCGPCAAPRSDLDKVFSMSSLGATDLVAVKATAPPAEARRGNAPTPTLRDRDSEQKMEGA